MGQLQRSREAQRADSGAIKPLNGLVAVNKAAKWTDYPTVDRMCFHRPTLRRLTRRCVSDIKRVFSC